MSGEITYHHDSGMILILASLHPMKFYILENIKIMKAIPAVALKRFKTRGIIKSKPNTLMFLLWIFFSSTKLSCVQVITLY